MRPIITFALTAVLTIIFASCEKKEQISVLDIVDNAEYGDTHAYAVWHGRYWEVFGNRGDAKFSALTTRIYTTSFDSIKKVIDDEFGPCEYSKANMPKNLISDDGFYWHLSKPSCDDVYYWSNDTLTIAWALFEILDDYGYAYLDIEWSPSPWVRELKNKNPLRNDTNYISVYFRFDTIINNFEVSGIFYPTYDEDNEADYFHGWYYEVGARLFFRNMETGKEYVWTDYEESCHCFKSIFMSKNVHGIITSDGFCGFKNGDAYVFDYITFVYDDAENPFYRFAEYQFWDVDNDGEDELLLGYFGGGPHGITLYEAYEMTDSGLVSKSMTFDEHSLVNLKNKKVYVVAGLMMADSLKSSHPRASFPKITSFADYAYERHSVFTRNDSDSVGHLRQLDLEFPTGMRNTKVLAKIQEQLLDTIFAGHFHTTSIEKVLSARWNVSGTEIKSLSKYPSEVPNDSDEYFEYGDVHNIHFDHLCGRTVHNENGLYIMRHHYSWFDGGCHHFPDTKYLSFDTRTGDYIRFTDIFSEEHEDTLHHMIYDISYVVDDMLRDKYSGIYTQYWDEASFTIKPDALVLHYTHYTLGCWADGENEIEIPSYIARLFLNDNWKQMFP